MNTLLMILFMSNNYALNLPPGLLESVCYIESKHNPNAIAHMDGHSDSLGICMIKLNTARWLGFKGTYKQLMNPAINIYYAGLYLKINLWKYGDVHRALMAYNQGHLNGMSNTSEYSRKVIKHWKVAYNDANIY